MLGGRQLFLLGMFSSKSASFWPFGWWTNTSMKYPVLMKVDWRCSISIGKGWKNDQGGYVIGVFWKKSAPTFVQGPDGMGGRLRHQISWRGRLSGVLPKLPEDLLSFRRWWFCWVLTTQIIFHVLVWKGQIYVLLSPQKTEFAWQVLKVSLKTHQTCATLTVIREIPTDLGLQNIEGRLTLDMFQCYPVCTRWCMMVVQSSTRDLQLTAEHLVSLKLEKL